MTILGYRHERESRIAVTLHRESLCEKTIAKREENRSTMRNERDDVSPRTFEVEATTTGYSAEQLDVAVQDD